MTYIRLLKYYLNFINAKQNKIETKEKKKIEISFFFYVWLSQITFYYNI